ncbi:MAG: glucose-6-phosphate isomerase [Candidatus Pelagibacter sp.]
MLTQNINFSKFGVNKNYFKTKIFVKKTLKKYSKDKFFQSLSNRYIYSFSKKKILKYKKFNNFNIIGIGGSSLGIEAIYNFLSFKIKKKFNFYNNINSNKFLEKKKIKSLNIVISKSGNTLETISNFNILNNKKNNLFISEKSNNYLRKLANKLKCEVLEHRNYIGGRYSVLSEVGMLPSILMGLKEEKFKNFDNLIKNTKFIDGLIDSVSSTIFYIKNKKFNSIILNYDERSEELFKWYQQLLAESLGKKSKGLLPIISTMPKDNHSLMQLYLDGPKNSFYTFFDVIEKKSSKINNSLILNSHNYLKNKSFLDIKTAQKKATQTVFKNKKIPFRSFNVLNRSENSLGEIFTFFMLETILLGNALKVNPFDQPSVELIKIETNKILRKN